MEERGMVDEKSGCIQSGGRKQKRRIDGRTACCRGGRGVDNESEGWGSIYSFSKVWFEICGHTMVLTRQ